jgi:protein TonB
MESVNNKKETNKRVLKKQINLNWNSRIFFQVGLIISMLTMFFVLELEIGPKPQATAPRTTSMWEDPSIINYTVEKDVLVPKVKPKDIVKRKPVQLVTPIAHTFEKVPDNSKVTEGEVTPVTEPIAPVVPEPEIPVPGVDKTTSILGVEHVPVFPGCEQLGTNNEKIDCMAGKIKDFIARKFDAGKFDYFEPGSVQIIHTKFTINSEGNITEVLARSHDKKLEQEAIRVIEKLPGMKPGKQGNTAVNVTYAVPIHFQIHK